MTDLFELLKKTNQAGVYRLVNRLEKSSYISYSSNISKSLPRLLDSNLLFPEYDFELLEIVTDPINLRPRCQFYKDYHSSNGETLINPNRVSSWKLHISIIDEFRVGKGRQSLFHVYVSSKGYKRLTVGVFNDYSSVDVFCAQNYEGGKVYKIVTATDELTQEYLKHANN